VRLLFNAAVYFIFQTLTEHVFFFFLLRAPLFFSSHSFDPIHIQPLGGYSFSNAGADGDDEQAASSSIRPLLTLSALPKAKWQTLIQLDQIKVHFSKLIELFFFSV
jgi:hypothetical protein